MAYTMENLLSVLHPHCPVKVDALRNKRRRVEHGFTTVGLKVHCLGDNRPLLTLVEALGGRSLTTTSHSFIIGPRCRFDSGDYTQANYIFRAIARRGDR